MTRQALLNDIARTHHANLLREAEKARRVVRSRSLSRLANFLRGLAALFV